MPKPYLVEPFVNSIGQVINPGDSVIAISQGYCHNICIKKGKYLGLRKYLNRVENVVVEVSKRRSKWDGKKHHFSDYVGTTSLPGLRIFLTVP